DLPAPGRWRGHPGDPPALHGRRRDRTPGLTMGDLGIDLPAGHTLVLLAERPDPIRPCGRFNGSVWPTFMLQDAQADRHWHHFEEDFPAFQLVLLDAAGEIAA